MPKFRTIAMLGILGSTAFAQAALAEDCPDHTIGWAQEKWRIARDSIHATPIGRRLHAVLEAIPSRLTAEDREALRGAETRASRIAWRRRFEERIGHLLPSGLSTSWVGDTLAWEIHLEGDANSEAQPLRFDLAAIFGRPAAPHEEQSALLDPWTWGLMRLTILRTGWTDPLPEHPTYAEYQRRHCRFHTPMPAAWTADSDSAEREPPEVTQPPSRPATGSAAPPAN